MTEQARTDGMAFWVVPVVMVSGALGLMGALQGMAFWNVANWTPLPVSLLMWIGLAVMGMGLGLWEMRQAQTLLDRDSLQQWMSTHQGHLASIGLASYLALAFCLYLFHQQPGHLATVLLAVAAGAVVMFVREQTGQFTS